MPKKREEPLTIAKPPTPRNRIHIISTELSKPRSENANYHQGVLEQYLILTCTKGKSSYRYTVWISQADAIRIIQIFSPNPKAPYHVEVERYDKHGNFPIHNVTNRDELVMYLQQRLQELSMSN